MGLEVAPASLRWSQPSVPHSPPSPQTLASAISTPSSRRINFVSGDGGVLFCRYVGKPALFSSGHQSPKLYRPRSCGSMSSRAQIIRGCLTASLDSFFDEEFSKKIQELALRFQLREDDDHDAIGRRLENFKPFDSLEPPDSLERNETYPANIERKANGVDIPLSLRTMEGKNRRKEGVMEVGESARCSVKKAFSSMVFIIRELHSFTLQMREIFFYEDLQGMLATVQNEIHASFVWLFQKVFSHSPTLMIYVMVLLTNYTVYSMSTSAAIAATPQVQGCAVTKMEHVDHSSSKQNFDFLIVRTLKLTSSNGKAASVAGYNGGGGGKYKSIASGTDGDGMFDELNNGVSSISTRTSGEESVSRRASIEEEETFWCSIVEEASEMQAASRDEALDQETIQRCASPVDAKSATVEHSEYLKTELLYQTELAQEPNNPLLLANYAQFLYLVAQDFDRAEEYFKRAAKAEPKDAEALNKYANFLWEVRDDLWTAEETYLEAISAEPDNTYYAANYAHFLWNTGGEDTCFPLSSPDSTADM